MDGSGNDDFDWDNDDVPVTLSGDPVINEARKRFDRCSEWEAVARQRFIDDIKFAQGDSDNNFQWPNGIRNSRDTQGKPSLTMNLIKQHNNMISNQARKNKSTVKYLGMGNGATQESANVLQDIHRHIEYQSQAQTAYTIARGFAIDGGIGWWRIVTDYLPGTWDQEIYIRPVNDPLSIYLDPDIEMRNGSDAGFGFVFDDIPKSDFDEAYPKYRGMIGRQPLGLSSIGTNWVKKDHIRVCEYFRKVKRPAKIVSFVHQGERLTIDHRNFKRLMTDKERRKYVLDLPTTRIRDSIETDVEWKLIAGDNVIDETVWIGKYIPLIRVIGDETVIEGILDRKGHTRWMKDAQRTFNYNASAQAEFVALQTKTPWLVTAEAIEEHEEQWASANVKNASVLVYNATKIDGPDGSPLPPPQRIEPPTAAGGYQQGMDNAAQHIMMVSGQFQNQLGMMGNERTGAAIEKRQEQSDTANFHFQDNYEESLVFTGMQLVDLIPKIYDTKRIMHVISDDGVSYDLEIDPGLRQPYLEDIRHDGEVIKRIFNPRLGRYDVAATVGPNYDTGRQETAAALTLILTQAPGLTGIIGDLLLSSLSFDKAQEAATRLRRMVPQQALGRGPTQTEQQLQQQVAQLQAMLQKALHVTAKDQLKLVGKDQLRDIEVYDAETKRMAALQKMLPTDPEGLRKLIDKLVQESMSTSIESIAAENASEINEGSATEETQPEETPPVPGALKANGYWHVLDPTRKGKWLRMEPLAQPEVRRG